LREDQKTNIFGEKGFAIDRGQKSVVSPARAGKTDGNEKKKSWNFPVECRATNLKEGGGGTARNIRAWRCT
jgi:hypothetical protein